VEEGRSKRRHVQPRAGPCPAAAHVPQTVRGLQVFGRPEQKSSAEVEELAVMMLTLMKKKRMKKMKTMKTMTTISSLKMLLLLQVLGLAV
jgi:hypothetical protein